MPKAVLLRVGIDSGAGGLQSPLFSDGSYELVCIPDDHGVSDKTYGNFRGRNGRIHADYFPVRRQARMATTHVHVDPEFKTFTYGDPTRPKRSLLRLEKGDYLIFYAGMQRWSDRLGQFADSPAALFLIGYFVVEKAGLSTSFTRRELAEDFANNFHVRHKSLLKQQRQELLLIRGGRGSRQLKKAVKISGIGTDSQGRPLKILSKSMQKHFGSFGGRNSLQRSPPRWVSPTHTDRAITFVRGLD